MVERTLTQRRGNKPTLSGPGSVTALLGLLAVFATCMPLVAQSQPTPEGNLAQAKQAFNGNFLLWPSMKALRDYSWEAVLEFNRLDSKNSPVESLGSVVIRYESNSDTADHRVYHDGKLLKASDFPLSELWCQSCPVSVPSCLEARSQTWARTRFEFVGDDNLNGRASLVFRFETARPSKKDFPLALESANSAGKLWLDAADLMLVKAEGEYTREVVRVKGFIVGGSVVSKGTKWRWEMWRTQNGDWLPSYYEESIPEHKLLWGKQFRQKIVNFHFDIEAEP